MNGTGAAGEPDPDEPEPSLGGLLRDLAGETQELFRQEVELVRAELGDGVRRTAAGVSWVAAGAAIVLIAMLVLLAALVVGLGDLLDSYLLSTLIVGLLFVLIGAALAITNAAARRRREPALRAAIGTLHADKRWAGAEVQQLTHDLTRPPSEGPRRSKHGQDG
ncbi:MAG: phage holin family protein [Gemmatimonadetes bacterium]|nr:phage holin family protein [Gemmatimonadota bacterium]